MSQSQKIFTFGVLKNYEWILRHMFRFHRWIPLPKPVTNVA